jgi:glutamate racemase
MLLSSKERIAFIKAISKELPIAMTSPVAFICVPKIREAVKNLANGHLGIFTTT